MTRAALHQLIDQLPESALDTTAALIEAARTGDRSLIQTLLADEEDMEPGDAEALAEVDRNDSVAEIDVYRRYCLA